MLMQVKCLLDMMEQVMISETSKYLSKLHHLMLNERERDDATLPLDLWKSNVSPSPPVRLPPTQWNPLHRVNSSAVEPVSSDH